MHGPGGAATHGLLLDDACARLAAEGVAHLFVTDSVPSHVEQRETLHVVSIAGAVAAAIRLQLVERDGARRPGMLQRKGRNDRFHAPLLVRHRDRGGARERGEEKE